MKGLGKLLAARHRVSRRCARPESWKHVQMVSDGDLLLTALTSCLQELVADKPELAPLVERLFAEALDARGTDWATVSALHAALHAGAPCCAVLM